MVRIKDIAERAGVSTTTVSNVLNNNTKKVSPENIEKINRLAHEMGYVSKKSFSPSSDSHPQLIAVVVNYHKIYEDSILTDPFYGQIIGVIEAALRREGFYMLLYAAPDIDDIFQMISVWNVAGIIAVTFSASNCEKLLHIVNQPIISIDAHEQPNVVSHVPNVGLDNYEGGAMMINHLLEKGYENILVCTQKDFGNDHTRWIGAQDAFRRSAAPQKHKIQLDVIGPSWGSRKQYYRSLAKRIPTFRKKTAAFFLADYFAMEAISVLGTYNISIPDQIGISGFDGLLIGSRWASPSLSSIQQDIEQKGEIAVRELLAMIRDPNYKSHDFFLPLMLIPRDSV